MIHSLNWFFVFEDDKTSEIFLSNNSLVHHQTEMFIKTSTMSMFSMHKKKTINTGFKDIQLKDKSVKAYAVATSPRCVVKILYYYYKKFHWNMKHFTSRH